MDQRDQIIPMEVEVHKKGWQTDTVSVQHLGTLKVLGYHLDTDLGGSTIQADLTATHDGARSHEAQIPRH